MTRKQVELAIGALLVIGGGIVLHNRQGRWPAHRPLTSQEWKADFPGDTKQVLEQSQHLTLLTLDPMSMNSNAPPPSFHGYDVLDQTQVSPQVKAQLIAALYDGMTVNPAEFAACFSPRHGIHATLGKKWVDLVICFHCQQFLVYPGRKDNYIFVSKCTQPAFDQALNDAGVPLSPT